MYGRACSYICAPPPMWISVSSSVFAFSIASSSDGTTMTPSATKDRPWESFKDGPWWLITMLVRSGKGLPKYPTMDSKVLRPMMTGCPFVSALKRLRSSGMCQSSFPSFPNSRFFPIATTAQILAVIRYAGKSVFSFLRSPLKTSFISAAFSFIPFSTTSFWCQRLLRGSTLCVSSSKTIWQKRSPGWSWMTCEFVLLRIGAVVFKRVNAPRHAALGRHPPRLGDKEREAEAEVDRMRLELERVETGSEYDIALLHTGENFGFGQDGHGSPLYPPTGTRRRRALGGVSQADGPRGSAAPAGAESDPPEPAPTGSTQRFAFL